VSSTVDEAADTARDITTGGIESSIGAISNVGGPSDNSGTVGSSTAAGKKTVEGIGIESPIDDEPDDPVERVEAGLDDISQTIQPTLRGAGDIVGQGVATASLAPAVEEAAFGTRRSEDAIRDFTQEAALAADPAAAASGAIDVAQFTFGNREITAGNPGLGSAQFAESGRDERIAAIQSSAFGAAQSFDERPVESTARAAGAIAGGFGFGTAAARGGRRLAGGLGSADDVGGATRTGSQIDTGGLGSRGSGSLFDSDAVTQANRQSRGGSTTTTSAESGTQPLGGSGGSTAPTASLDRIAEGVESGRIGQSRAAVRDLNDRVEDIDFFGDNRASAQLGRQRSREPRQSQTPEINDDRVTPNLYQQSVDDQLRRQRRATEDSTFDGGGSPFSDNTLRRQREADAEAIARRDRLGRSTDTDAVGDSPTGFGGLEGFGSGLGVLSSVNDPSGIGDFSSPFGSDEDTGLGGGLGGGLGLGSRSGAEPESGIAGDTGTTSSGTTGTTTSTGTTSDTMPAQVFTLRETALTGTRPGQSAVSQQTTTSSTFGQPTRSGTFGQPTTGGGGRGPPTTGRPPTRTDFGLDDDEDDDEELLFGLEAYGRNFDSGILSGEEALTNVGGFDRGDANTARQVDRGLDDVFPGAPNYASRNDGFSL